MHIVSGSSVDDGLLATLITAASRAWDRKCAGVADAIDYFASAAVVNGSPNVTVIATAHGLSVGNYVRVTGTTTTPERSNCIQACCTCALVRSIREILRPPLAGNRNMILTTVSLL